MTDSDGNDAPAESPQDRRRYRRVPVNLPGRYLLEDGSEHACVCVDVSVGGIRLRAAQAGPWGSRVLAYIEGIGRIEGYVVRRAPGWFAIEARVTARKGERVQERIEWILNAQTAKRVDRRSTRERSREFVALVTADGRPHVAELTDISKTGAALLIELALEVDDSVRLDGRRARVARVFPGGVALEFENLDEGRPRETAARVARAKRA